MILADGRKNNGGNKNAGRKSKAEELQLVEKLSKFEPLFLEKLEEGIKTGKADFLKLYAGYMYGQPKQSVQMENTIKGSVDLDKWINQNSD